MRFAAQTILLALHAIALTGLLSKLTAPLHALASPIPMPLPLMAAEFSRDDLPMRPLDGTHAKGKRLAHVHGHNHTGHSDLHKASNENTVNTISSRRAAYVRRAFRERDIASYISLLNTYNTESNTHAQNLSNLAERSSTVNDDDYDFQQQCASEMTGYHTSFLGFQTTLAQLAGDKGLANYDSSNNLETLLKDAVNANKNALSATAALVYNIPTLGPILGPTVYEIKCIIDDILDACENLTDGILNLLQPLLQPLSGKWLALSCSSGLGLVGLCL